MVQKLEIYNILDVPKNIISEVADTVDAARKVGIRSGQLTKSSGRSVQEGSLNSASRARLLRLQVEELQQEMEEFEHHLGELDTMIIRDFTTHTISNYKSSYQKKRVNVYYHNRNE